MAAVGKVTKTKIGKDIVVTDEAGESYIFKSRNKRPLLLDIDPRIDLTKPIYDQVTKLAAEDQAAEEWSR